ncbi:MAG: lysylphosphatidylglycerol synthase transmembrane domain-containing protein [Candidatus Omnitrophota bacterium]
MAILKKTLSIIFRVAISIALLVFIFRKADEKVLLELVRNADKPLLFFGFIIFFIAYPLCLFRWEMLLKAAQIRLPLKRVIISYAGGIFFNLFLPSTIGGDLVRSVDLASHTKKPRQIVATVLLDRLSGYIALALVALAAVILGWRLVGDVSVVVPVLIIAGLLVVILLVLFNNFAHSKVNKFLDSPTAGRIREAITSLHQEMHLFGKDKRLVIKNIGLSILIQFTGPLAFYLIGLSLGIKISFTYFLVFVPIVGAITLLPLSIGGLGLRDASMIYFFAKAGVGKDLAFAMSLLNFVFILICGSLGGIIYVFTVRNRRLQYHKSPPVSPAK